MKRIVVAALSARALTEAARREGFGVIALDVFGDADTRSAARRWQPIGDARALRIEREPLLEALARIAREDDADGWIGGGGFDGAPGLLDEGARCLPLVGNDAATVRRVRDPHALFAALDAHGVPHPPLRDDWPHDAPHEWLLKDAAGSGGWLVRPAAGVTPRPLAAGEYLQRCRDDATPMSATFVADGSRARIAGCNLQFVRAIGDAPYVWSGAIGPLPLGDAVHRAVDAALQSLVPHFGLRGWASLDFLLRGDEIEVLEINPRPPASLALYAAAGWPVIDAQLRACAGELPAFAVQRTAPRGLMTIHAPRELALDDVALHRLADLSHVHDRPARATRFRAHDPVCSVSAAGSDVTAVQSQLARRTREVLEDLEWPA